MLRHIIIAAFSFLAITASAETQFKPTPFYGQRASLFASLPTDTTDIIMLGNSITNGCEWHELLGRPNVKNRGISGDITDGVLARLKPVTDGKPAKIFLMIGINDLSRNVPADTVARNIFEIADYIHSNSPRTQLFVQSVLPVNEAFGRYKGIVGKDQDVVDLNRLLKAGNKAHEYQYIDLYSLFINADGRLDSRFTNDGLHLTADGYKLWRVVLEPYLNR